MRKRPHYLEPEDDGLVPIPGPIININGMRRHILVTPEEAHARAVEKMAGFDELSPAERYAYNYSSVSRIFNPSASPTRYKNRRDKKAVKSAGARALLDDLGL